MIPTLLPFYLFKSNLSRVTYCHAVFLWYTNLIRGCKFVSFQESRLQEMPEDVPIGHIPRSLSLHLTAELTRSLQPGVMPLSLQHTHTHTLSLPPQWTPSIFLHYLQLSNSNIPSLGDRVTIFGIFLPTPYTGFNAFKAGLIADTYIEVCHVRKQKQSYSQVLVFCYLSLTHTISLSLILSLSISLIVSVRAHAWDGGPHPKGFTRLASPFLSLSPSFSLSFFYSFSCTLFLSFVFSLSLSLSPLSHRTGYVFKISNVHRSGDFWTWGCEKSGACVCVCVHTIISVYVCISSAYLKLFFSPSFPLSFSLPLSFPPFPSISLTRTQVLLLMVGAPSREMKDGMRIRGELNVCLMGDPGVAKVWKSTFLSLSISLARSLFLSPHDPSLSPVPATQACCCHLPSWGLYIREVLDWGGSDCRCDPRHADWRGLCAHTYLYFHKHTSIYTHTHMRTHSCTRNDTHILIYLSMRYLC